MLQSVGALKLSFQNHRETRLFPINKPNISGSVRDRSTTYHFGSQGSSGLHIL